MCYFLLSITAQVDLVYVVSLSNGLNLLEMISSQQRGIKVLLHKSLKLHFLTLFRCVLPAATLITITCNRYLIPASRYVGSTLLECNGKNNRVRVQRDKADSLCYYEHTVTLWGSFCPYTVFLRGAGDI